MGVVVAKSEEAVNAWVKGVAGCRAMGLDIEYRPVFKRGIPQSKTSVLQLSVGDSVLVAQLLQIGGIPSALAELLEDGSVAKAGVGIDEDVRKLLRDWHVTVRGAVDLSRLMQTQCAEPSYLSLAKLSLRVLGLDMCKQKKITLSNWEKKNLTTEQIRYAALDAWVGSECFAVLGSADQDNITHETAS
jgi:ribonuclease D